MKPRHYNIPVFLPELACPHRCVFCNQNEISGVSEAPHPSEIGEFIHKYLETIPISDSEIQIAFFGGSFTGLPISDQIAYLKAANEISDSRISGIRLSTRPDYISLEILDILKEYSVTHIELGAQSMSPDVLRASSRGHSVADVEVASRMILENGFALGLQMMIGLPLDSEEKSIYTAQRIIELGATETRIYPTLVVKNTPLERLFREGKFRPLELLEAVSLAAKLYDVFIENSVNVLRVGLYPSEDFINMNSLVAGPFHPNFKELVLSELWRVRIEKINLQPSVMNVIYVAPTSLNHAVGFAKSNLLFFRQQGFKIKFLPDSDLKLNEYYVDYQ